VPFVFFVVEPKRLFDIKTTKERDGMDTEGK
jgi:hypothetical protein